MTAIKELQENLLTLWESIPEYLRLGQSYTFDASPPLVKQPNKRQF